jgi:5-methylcytosine-specific restriction endonuclease McrA
MKPIDKKTRDYIYRRDQKKCRICGTPLHEYGHIHHLYHRNGILPVWAGIEHSNHPRNLVLLCPLCHQKLHTPPAKYAAYWAEWREKAILVNIASEYEIPVEEIFKHREAINEAIQKK